MARFASVRHHRSILTMKKLQNFILIYYEYDTETAESPICKSPVAGPSPGMIGGCNTCARQRLCPPLGAC